MRMIKLAAVLITLAGCVGDAPQEESNLPTTDQDVPAGADQNVNTADRVEPAVATSWTQCGCGQNLASLNGQAARCDGAGDVTCAGVGTYGYQYQCVELVNRYEQIVKHKPHIFANAGTMFCDAAKNTSGYTSWGPNYKSNHGHKPGVGDILVWNSDYGAGTGYAGHDAGHVAIVTGSDSTHLFYIQQNWGWYINGVWGQLGQSSTPWNNSTSWFGAPGADINSTFHVPACWVHPE